MKSIKAGDRELLLVPIPEDAHNIWVMPILYKDITCQLHWDDKYGHDGSCEKNLIPGSWQLLGKGSEITNSEWGKFMKVPYEVVNIDGEDRPRLIDRTAKESGLSLLAAKGYPEPDKVVILLKQ